MIVFHDPHNLQGIDNWLQEGNHRIRTNEVDRNTGREYHLRRSRESGGLEGSIQSPVIDRAMLKKDLPQILIGASSSSKMG